MQSSANKKNFHLEEAEDLNLFEKYQFIKHSSMVPHLKIGTLDCDLNVVMEEIKLIENQFVKHRGDKHPGWRSIVLHGSAWNETEDYGEYGYSSRDEVNYHWTSISYFCPTLTKAIKDFFRWDVYHRIRIMKLEPNGIISPHADLDRRELAATNIAINNPESCYFLQEQYGTIPWKPGDVRMLDLGLRHSVVNLSNESRYHVIVHGEDHHKSWQKKMVNAYYD